MVSRTESDARYARPEKGKAGHARYNESLKGWVRSNRYEHTAAGMRRKIDYDLRRGRNSEWILEGPRGDALREREEYEASGTSLSFIDWVNETYPLPKLGMLTT